MRGRFRLSFETHPGVAATPWAIEDERGIRHYTAGVAGTAPWQFVHQPAGVGAPRPRGYMEVRGVLTFDPAGSRIDALDCGLRNAECGMAAEGDNGQGNQGG